MRNISFALTTNQFRERSKFVTRRLKWLKLRRGDVLQGVVKCMGLRPDEKIEPLGKILVIDVRREFLDRMWNEPGYGNAEALLEGFPDMTGQEFAMMFVKHMGVPLSTEVTRIEYQYIDQVSPVPDGWLRTLRGMLRPSTRDGSVFRNYTAVAIGHDDHTALLKMRWAGLVFEGHQLNTSAGPFLAFHATELGCQAIGLTKSQTKRALEIAHEVRNAQV